MQLEGEERQFYSEALTHEIREYTNSDGEKMHLRWFAINVKPGQVRRGVVPTKNMRLVLLPIEEEDRQGNPRHQPDDKEDGNGLQYIKVALAFTSSGAPVFQDRPELPGWMSHGLQSAILAEWRSACKCNKKPTQLGSEVRPQNPALSQTLNLWLIAQVLDLASKPFT